MHFPKVIRTHAELVKFFDEFDAKQARLEYEQELRAFELAVRASRAGRTFWTGSAFRQVSQDGIRWTPRRGGAA